MNSKDAETEHDHDEEPLYEELELPETLDGLQISWPEPSTDSCCTTSHFDAAVLHLHATSDASLRWDKELELLQKTNKKFVVFLDCGLFNNLKLPLSHKAQFLSLGLAVSHYVETIVKPYQERILGTILFAGDLFSELALSHPSYRQSFDEWKAAYYPDFEESSEEILFPYFAIDHAFDFLHLMGNMLPRRQNAIVVIENKGTLSSTHFCKMLFAAKKSNLILTISNPPFMAGAGIFQRGADYGFAIGCSPITLQEKPLITCAIVLHEADIAKDADTVNALVRTLQEKQIHFRVIPEETLVAEWEGIETIYIPKRLLDMPLIKRKLQGFIAAQGTVIAL